MELRPTVADDLPAMHRLFLSAIGSVYEPHDFEPPAPPAEVFAANHCHLLATDPERCFVAEHESEIVGYVAAWLRGDDWFLGSLFVAPASHGRGVGTRLLDAAWGEGAIRRRTLTDAIQPVSNALYARRGLVPATPLLAFFGQPRDARETLAAGGERGLDEIDLRAYGFDRAVDHRYWAQAAERTIWLRGERPVAYSYRYPGGAIGPVAGVDPAAAAAALASELARADGSVTVRIPGTSRALVLCALAAGLRLWPTPGLLLLSEGVVAPDALAVGGYTLF